MGVDVSSNAFGLSSYYGYASTNQLVGNNLLLPYSAAGTLFQDINNDPQQGMELTYSRLLGVGTAPINTDGSKITTFGQFDGTGSSGGITNPGEVTKLTSAG